MELMVSGFGFQVSGLGFRVSSLWLMVSGFGSRNFPDLVTLSETVQTKSPSKSE